jgi:hypothetical protein
MSITNRYYVRNCENPESCYVDEAEHGKSREQLAAEKAAVKRRKARLERKKRQSELAVENARTSADKVSAVVQQWSDNMGGFFGMGASPSPSPQKKRSANASYNADGTSASSSDDDVSGNNGNLHSLISETFRNSFKMSTIIHTSVDNSSVYYEVVHLYLKFGFHTRLFGFLR